MDRFFFDAVVVVDDDEAAAVVVVAGTLLSALPRSWLIVNAKFLNKLGFLNDHTEQGRGFLGMIPVFSSNGLVDWTETSVPSTRQFTL
jgi:hypothetical protein